MLVRDSSSLSLVEGKPQIPDAGWSGVYRFWNPVAMGPGFVVASVRDQPHFPTRASPTPRSDGCHGTRKGFRVPEYDYKYSYLVGKRTVILQLYS